MDERAEGIILRLVPLTESSLIVRWITREQGRISTVAKGARRPKSTFAGKLDLYFQAGFSFQRSRRSDLHMLKEIALRDAHSALRTELGWLQQAAYAAALIELATEAETPLPDIYELWAQFLHGLTLGPPNPLVTLSWETKFLSVSGLAPEWNTLARSQGARQLLEHCASSDWPLIQRLKASPGQVEEMRLSLGAQILSAFGQVPRQRALALTLA